MTYWLAVGMSAVLTILFVPVMQKIALKYGIVDRPNWRKIHNRPIPLMGGAALYIACILTIIAFQGITSLSLCIMVGGALLVCIGLMDDASKAKGKDFPVWPRVIIYLGVSTIPLLFGIHMDGVTNPANGHFFGFPIWFDAIGTIIWVFALINMINFIDGVDGLASGVCTLSSLTLFVTALIKGQADIGVTAIIIGGACIGFLIYNFHPARIFMGDAGATFLGYTLAVIAIDGAFKKATFITILVPLLALGLPILDTVIVMLRRLATGKGLHQADKLHTHHALMRWGLTQVQTVSFMYLIAALFSLLSILLLVMKG
ncbi:UDP-GlcNAc:undecaprenyl-phosphate GlcNAc-1-phosphate transferase [Paenibacillus catalpae]|uniref:UDP-GlcNAc:undecaprenyl-phosphate GlcNAc-1-phosphate transferase n=1 Tax=Paenibacillus catalpae TaxID=1045775 RepID=A0A1I2I0F3_9BACL|nr:MraY family glycosyltransferase [Paenibacillus catalpae]SFF35819.1 UDP-GlcNAc:undecaprenyl-phosphate GlcNAc-1-phosphate transferase [Paenibacillus catalpae]